MTEQADTQEISHKVEGLGQEKIKGVFSTQSVVKVGTGTTQRKTIQKTFWFCEEEDDGTIQVQPLNVNYIPSGSKRDVPRDDFLSKFNPEPEFYVSTVFPKMQELNETIVRGEKHRSRGAAYSAEFEFKQATNIDEDNVRANFGLGLTYLDRGEQTKANDIFKRLVNLEAAFEEEHKHLFNDFGINLRKNNMYDQALEYYLRAEGLVEDDENLFHNIARVYFEKGDLDNCVSYLKKSLVLNPRLEESVMFMDHLKRNGLVPGDGGAAAKSGKKPKAENLDLSLD